MLYSMFFLRLASTQPALQTVFKGTKIAPVSVSGTALPIIKAR